MSRRFLLIVLVSVCLSLAASSQGSAIIVKTIRGDIIRGHLVDEDDKNLSIKTYSAEGKETVLKIERNRVKIIHRVDLAKLGELSPKEPAAYRDYAAKLAAKPDDPEAKTFARRLYLLGAFHAEGKMRRECLVAMADVANDAAEAGRIRALAYMLDSKRDPSLLKPKAAKSDLSWNDFRISLLALRRGKVSIALKYATKPGAAECFAVFPGFMSLEQFQKMCQKMQCDCKGDGAIKCPQCNGKGIIPGRGQCNNCRKLGIITGKVTCPDCEGRGVAQELTNAQLRLLLTTELRVEKKETIANRKSGGTSWSIGLANHGVAPLHELNLETVTEIDPRKCVYKNGAWVTP